MLTRIPAAYRHRIKRTEERMTDRGSPSMNPSDPEPEPYRNLSRRQLIDWIQSLTIESAKHRRGKRYWKNYAQQLENKLDNV